MKIDDIYEVVIDSVDINGNGVCRIKNIVTFVFGALESEIVKIKIINISKHYASGKIIKILKSSNDRVNVPCPYYDKCGGCSFLHTSIENEMNIKKQTLESLFNMKVHVLDVQKEYNYRNKVVLHVLNGKLGYFDSKTHNLCEIDSCMLLSPKINLKIHELNNYDLNGINEIMIRAINDNLMINITGDFISNDIYNIECESLYLNNEYIKGKKYLIDNINNLKYTIYPESFYQINREGMISVYNKAKEYAESGKILFDLYTGTGTIGIYLNNNFDKVIGIEINKSSIKNANINKKLNNINNIDFVLGDSKLISKYIKNDSLLIVDPPRSGLSKNVVNTLNNYKLDKIIYISCNYKTMKRDIDLLINYEITDLSICNMFPKTKHIECACVLHRKTFEK